MLFYIRDPKYRPTECQVPRPSGNSMAASRKSEVQKMAASAGSMGHPAPRAAEQVVNKKDRSNGNHKGNDHARSRV